MVNGELCAVKEEKAVGTYVKDARRGEKRSEIGY
jgi:hypothetical protein